MRMVLQRHERRWPASLAVVAVMALQAVVPREVLATPWWLFPALELALIVPIAAANPVRLSKDIGALRIAALVLVGAIAVANVWNLLQLIAYLTSGATSDPRTLVETALLIWVTNVVLGALAFWETDAGGPFARAGTAGRAPERPDLLFPQLTVDVPGWDRETWRPGFVDYLFVSFTAATAFSPTDTMPLSAAAKLIMTFVSAVSFLTIALVVARAVNAV